MAEGFNSLGNQRKELGNPSSSTSNRDDPKVDLQDLTIVKGLKRKKRQVEEEEDVEKNVNENVGGEEENERKANESVHELSGIPILPSDVNSKAGVIFILERASLEVAKVGKILNSDDHANFLRKHKRNPADCRPDIVHQALLAILDSPLNKAGKLRALYVKTEKGLIFEVKPYVRMPRTFKRFCGVMSQLLQKLSISATSKREKLLHMIENPVTRHLPVNSRKIGLSHCSEKLVQLWDYVGAASDDATFVFVVFSIFYNCLLLFCWELLYAYFS
ncbi:uncharacterized protein LOC143892116 [Tasmannia lanceolata]|uniref:uncharacterized protein LOC143892116 n=1 Tax=Tasmannia lanceolata TaxID=3420 RepID=UPI00406372B0